MSLKHYNDAWVIHKNFLVVLGVYWNGWASDADYRKSLYMNEGPQKKKDDNLGITSHILMQVFILG